MLTEPLPPGPLPPPKAPLGLRGDIPERTSSDLNNSPLNVHFYALYFDGVTS